VPVNEPKSIQRFFRGVFGSHAMDDIETGNDKYKHITSKSASIGSRMSTAYSAIPSLVEEEIESFYSEKSETADTIGKGLFFIGLFVISVFNAIYSGDVQEAGVAVLLVYVFICAILTMFLIRLCTIYYKRKARTHGVGVTLMHFVLWFIGYYIAAFIYLFICASFGKYETSMYMLMRMNPATLAAIILLIVAPVLVIGMKSRSDENAELFGRILGFREFIRTAELPKLQELVEQDPNYFYNILPYAYIFGLTKKWAKKFENIAISEPEWYHPYGTHTSGYHFRPTEMHSAFNSVSTNISSKMFKSDVGSSFSGGFSGGGGGFSGGGGGGFSGGGFGGGGGGTW